MLEYILITSDQQTVEDMSKLYRGFIPLLNQYKDIVLHELISTVAAQRVLGKMQSVLLNAFTELATKVS